MHQKASSYRRSIPQDVIDTHIFPRLPIKSLLRFKSVSRQWNSIISSHTFAINYLQDCRSNKSNNTTSIVYQIEQRKDTELMLSKLFLLEVDGNTTGMEGKKISNLKLLRLEHGYEPPYDVRMNENLIGSCNGLICVQFTSKEYVDARRGLITCFLMWNPLLKHRRSIRGPFLPFQSCVISSGFGFNSSTGDFKIVVLNKALGLDSEPIVVHIFSSRRDRWIKHNTKDRFPLIDLLTGVAQPQPTLAGETLYWLITDKKYGSKIVAFELNTDSFYLVPLPEDIPAILADGDSLFLCEIRQRLCFCWLNSGGSRTATDLEVWMLQDSWTQFFHYKDLDKSKFGNNQTLFELKDQEAEKDFVLQDPGEKEVSFISLSLKHLVSIHTRHRLTKYLPMPVLAHDSTLGQNFSHVQSLVSPFYNLGRMPTTRKAKKATMNFVKFIED